VKRIPLLSLVVVLACAFAATGAAGDGGGPASIKLGGQGVLAPDGKLRYVAHLMKGGQTKVSVVRVRDGKIVRSRLVSGHVGVPVVGLDGTTDGVSADGRMLVLASLPSLSRTGTANTRFAVLDTASLRPRTIDLPGRWSYDALSPDGATLFLVEYLSATAQPPYRVRAYDLESRRLLRKIIVDRVSKGAVMYGEAVTRATSEDGRWAYTLYARARSTPFVHALDTMRRQARCVFLLRRMAMGKQHALRLRLDGDELAVRGGEATVAVIDTKTFAVREG
jgi:hypothetical protein